MTNPNKVGLVIGASIAAWHICWCALIATGVAQSFMDFVFWAHMINPVYVVRGFDPKAAVTLVIITFIMGYAFGFVAGIIWNRTHRTSNTR